jgi:hypothetical protein
MLPRLVRIWAVFAVVATAVFGLVMFAAPAAIGDLATVDYYGPTAGVRNVIFAVVLAAALRTQTNRVVGFLLLMRGLTEFGDAAATVMAGAPASAAGPVVLGVISVLAAVWLFRQPDGRFWPRATTTAEPAAV